jgi:hypothetical protein
MAQIPNFLFRGMRGRIGNVVFRQINGRTFASARPRRRPVQPTVRQLEQQARFREATAYAQAAVADPARREIYTRMTACESSAHSAAMRDFLCSPTITLLDVSRYTGHVGDAILVDATDDTAVATVKVEIRDQTSKLLESGFARFAGSWIYRTTTQPANGYPLVITSIARDHAGNQAHLAAPWIPPGYAAIATDDTKPCRLITGSAALAAASQPQP